MNKIRGFAGKKRHYLSKSPTWYSWSSMLSRCTNSKTPNFHRYGGRGISVCNEWFDFSKFLSDMGIRPEGTTLGRVDNDGNYSPDNCVWETVLTQQNNKSNSRLVEFNGQVKTVSEWARHNGMSIATLYTRLRRGWDFSDALLVPVNTKGELQC